MQLDLTLTGETVGILQKCFIWQQATIWICLQFRCYNNFKTVLFIYINIPSLQIDYSWSKSTEKLYCNQTQITNFRKNYWKVFLQEFQFFEIWSQHLHRVTILKKLYKLRQYYLAVRERRQLRKTRRPLERTLASLIYLQYLTVVCQIAVWGNLKWNFFI